MMTTIHAHTPMEIIHWEPVVEVYGIYVVLIMLMVVIWKGVI